MTGVFDIIKHKLREMVVGWGWWWGLQDKRGHNCPFNEDDIVLMMAISGFG